uniref:Uncharacterized protein n=1 Tax=Populus trichocarpa TaxID=3694 RepID=U5GKU7_POPTR
MCYEQQQKQSLHMIPPTGALCWIRSGYSINGSQMLTTKGSKVGTQTTTPYMYIQILHKRNAKLRTKTF